MSLTDLLWLAIAAYGLHILEENAQIGDTERHEMQKLPQITPNRLPAHSLYATSRQ
jgi:hypothetical protein